jgi:hypothetical protein
LVEAGRQDPAVVTAMIVDAAWQKLQANTPRRMRWKSFP